MNRSWKITSIIAGIVVASSAGLLTIETQICDALEPGPFALVDGRPEPNGGEETVTINSLTKPTKELVDKIVADLMSESLSPGVELSIQKDGKTIYEAGYGVIEKSGPRSKVPPGPNTRFQIDSLTKTFTAIAVLRLMEQGKVDLDQPMGKYVWLPNPSWRTIPVRSYLGMIAGVPDGSTTKGTYQSVIASVAQKPKDQTGYEEGLDFEPGSKYEYSNVNFFILGELVSAVSNPLTAWRGFMPFTKANVLKPLGMKDSGLIPLRRGCVGNPPRAHPDAFSSDGTPVSLHSVLSSTSWGLFCREPHKSASTA